MPRHDSDPSLLHCTGWPRYFASPRCLASTRLLPALARHQPHVATHDAATLTAYNAALLELCGGEQALGAGRAAAGVGGASDETHTRSLHARHQAGHHLAL